MVSPINSPINVRDYLNLSSEDEVTDEEKIVGDSEEEDASVTGNKRKQNTFEPMQVYKKPNTEKSKDVQIIDLDSDSETYPKNLKEIFTITIPFFEHPAQELQPNLKKLQNFEIGNAEKLDINLMDLLKEEEKNVSNFFQYIKLDIINNLFLNAQKINFKIDESTFLEKNITIVRSNLFYEIYFNNSTANKKTTKEKEFLDLTLSLIDRLNIKPDIKYANEDFFALLSGLRDCFGKKRVSRTNIFKYLKMMMQLISDAEKMPAKLLNSGMRSDKPIVTSTTITVSMVNQEKFDALPDGNYALDQLLKNEELSKKEDCSILFQFIKCKILLQLLISAQNNDDKALFLNFDPKNTIIQISNKTIHVISEEKQLGFFEQDYPFLFEGKAKLETKKKKQFFKEIFVKLNVIHFDSKCKEKMENFLQILPLQSGNVPTYHLSSLSQEFDVIINTTSEFQELNKKEVRITFSEEFSSKTK